jgi:hypothetical protein
VREFKCQLRDTSKTVMVLEVVKESIFLGYIISPLNIDK